MNIPLLTSLLIAKENLFKHEKRLELSTNEEEKRRLKAEIELDKAVIKSLEEKERTVYQAPNPAESTLKK